ncbi:MAG: hypothetical protein PHQ64_01400 [Bacilli bacterium]|nr:hypothetical protein [Bacilli bacterium]
MDKIKSLRILNSLVEETGKKEYIGAFIYFDDKAPEYFTAENLGELENVHSKIVSLVEEVQKQNDSKSVSDLQKDKLVRLYNFDDEKTQLSLLKEFVNETQLYNSLEVTEEEEIVEEIEKQKVKNKGFGKGFLAASILAGTLVATAYGLTSCEKQEDKTDTPTTVEDPEIDLEFADFEDYLANAPGTQQKDTMVKIHDFASNINDSADWMIQKDEDGKAVYDENGKEVKWGVTEEETLAFYVYQNNLTEEEMISIYNGREIDPEDITELRNSFVTKMIYFYTYDKTGNSNVADLFNSQKDKEAVLKFEQMNAKYNMADLKDKEDLALEMKDAFFHTYYDNMEEEYIGFSDENTSMAYILSSLVPEQQVINSTSSKVVNAYNQKTTIEGEEGLLIDVLRHEIDAHCEDFTERLVDYKENQERLTERDADIDSNKALVFEINSALEKGDNNTKISMQEDSEFDKLVEGTLDLDTVLGYVKDDLVLNGKYPNGTFDQFYFNDFDSLNKKQKSTSTTPTKKAEDVVIYQGNDRDKAVEAIGNNQALLESMKQQEQAIIKQNEENKKVAEQQAVNLAAIYDSIDNATYNFYKTNGTKAGDYNYQASLPGGLDSHVLGVCSQVFNDAKSRGLTAYNIVNNPTITGGQITDAPDTIPSTQQDSEKNLNTDTPVNPTPTDTTVVTPVAPVVEEGVIGGEITYPTDQLPSASEDPYLNMSGLDAPVETQSVDAQIDAIIAQYAEPQVENTEETTLVR